jgi:hypothetical protein
VGIEMPAKGSLKRFNTSLNPSEKKSKPLVEILPVDPSERNSLKD